MTKDKRYQCIKKTRTNFGKDCGEYSNHSKDLETRNDEAYYSFEGNNTFDGNAENKLSKIENNQKNVLANQEGDRKILSGRKVAKKENGLNIFFIGFSLALVVVGLLSAHYIKHISQDENIVKENLRIQARGTTTETSQFRQNQSEMTNQSSVKISKREGSTSTLTSMQEHSAPLQITTKETTVEEIVSHLSNSEVQRIFNQTMGIIRGNHGLYYRPLTVNGQSVYSYPLIMNDRLIRAASIIKLFILIALYERVEFGGFNIDGEYHLNADDIVGGTGDIQNDALGTSYTYRQLANAMIANSDNIAANVIIDALGGVEAVQDTIEQLGYNKSQMKRKLLDQAALSSGIDNYVSVSEVGDLLYKIYNKQMISKKASEEMLSFLKNQVHRTKLVANLPNDVISYNKTGTYDEYGINSDAAIIETPQGAFVVVVVSDSGDAQMQTDKLSQFGANLTEAFMAKNLK